MNGKDLLEGARLRVWNRHPYIGAVLMSLRMVEVPGLDTLGVDKGWRLYYDPKKCEEWGIDLLSGVVAHEVWHVLRDHFGRLLDRDPQLWNIANDLEINGDLLKANWTLPTDGQFPKNYKFEDGLLAEEYYALLEKLIEKAAKKMTAGGVAAGHCGSCAGHAHDHEPKDGEGNGSGQGKDKDKGNKGDGSGEKDGQGKSKTDVQPIPKWEQEVLRRQAALETQQAAKSQGNVPAGLRDWAEKELQPPKVDWKRQLQGVVRRAVTEVAGAVDSNYRKISRKGSGLRSYMGFGAPIMPAYHRPLPNVGLILDVSGSMCGGPAEAARNEIMGVVRAVGAEVMVYVADTRIAEKKKVRQAGDIAKLGETLGGTDMAEAIREVANMKKHDILIVLTDGYTGWHNAGEVKPTVLAAITPGGQLPPEHVRHVQIEA